MNNLNLIEQLKYIIAHHLPGEDAHLPMSPTGRGKSSEALANATDYRQSAVAIIFFKSQEEYRVILTQRGAYEGTHGGQISFPGGRKEEEDRDFTNTAIRETYEEIGIQLHSDALIGKLTNVFIPVSSFLVHPYVFFYDKNPVFTNNYEVSETFSISVADLLAKSSVSVMDIIVGNNFKMKVPCFRINRREIWGATAIMLNELKEIIKKAPELC